MKIINILTPGFIHQNSIAFLYPIIKFKNELKECGYRINIITKLNEDYFDCDISIIDSKYFRLDWHAPEKTIHQISEIKSNTGKLIYYDTTDSTGNIQTEILPIVDKYFKNQILKNKAKYNNEMYGARIYTNYYYNKYGVKDSYPVYSKPVVNKSDLDKIVVAWNSSICDYGVNSKYNHFIYKYFPVNNLLKLPKKFISPNSLRKNNYSLRFNSSYERESVSWQRKTLLNKLNIQNHRISKRQYMSELSNTKYAFSPFGFGEICYRDYEAILSGCILVKPDMNHLVTWPDLYKENETVLFHSWDIDNIDKYIEDLKNNYLKNIEIAFNAQKKYSNIMAKSEYFIGHFVELFKQI